MHPWCTVNVGHIFDPWGPLQLYKHTITVHHEQAIEWAWVQASSSTYITHDFDCYTTKQVSELDMNIQLDLHRSAVSGPHLLVVCQWLSALIKLYCSALLEWSKANHWLPQTRLLFKEHQVLQALTKVWPNVISPQNNALVLLAHKAFHMHAHIP